MENKHFPKENENFIHHIIQQEITSITGMMPRHILILMRQNTQRMKILVKLNLNLNIMYQHAIAIIKPLLRLKEDQLHYVRDLIYKMLRKIRELVLKFLILHLTF